MNDNALVKLERATQMLAECRSPKDAKRIADLAGAAADYARRAQLGEQAVRYAVEIRIDALTLMGEMLTETPDAKKGWAARQSLGLPREPEDIPTLHEIGISKKESQQAQALARAKEEEPSLYQRVRDGLVSLKEIAKTMARKAMRAAHAAKIVTAKDNPPPAIEGPFDLILADPPWRYDFSETDARQIENHYPTQGILEIIAQRPNAAANAVLFMWATAPKLPGSLDVIGQWGFIYKTHAIWDKVKPGMGYWFRGQHELLLVATRGNFSPPPEFARVSSIFTETRSAHSAKPTCVYDWIERAFPDASKLEMYARSPRPGWASWGNELSNTLTYA